MATNKILTPQTSEEDSWMSISDMMAGLMLVFLFIAIVYIRNIGQHANEINDTQEKICNELKQEFREVETAWRMSICENGLVIKFRNEAIFTQGNDRIAPEFQVILRDFYPRFMKIIWLNQAKISELRIEGNTSSEGARGMDQFDAYLYNTQLSQNRSINVMYFVLNIAKIKTNSDYLIWSYQNLTAHGLSSSNLVISQNLEDRVNSRRVEFRLKTTAQDELLQLIKTIQ